MHQIKIKLNAKLKSILFDSFQINLLPDTMPVDLVKTIRDEDDVPDFSENSDSEEEAQPQKKRVLTKHGSKDFNSEFQFVSNQKDYMKDSWNDVSKYMKKTENNKTDEKGWI